MEKYINLIENQKIFANLYRIQKAERKKLKQDKAQAKRKLYLRTLLDNII
tara:strand:- start:1201 stop:1350 length:150 start_codon:yes stop_codon:yes gene_type:complete